MNIDSLENLLIGEMQELIEVERQLARLLPEMADAAFSTKLQEALHSHAAQTEEHVRRLNRAFHVLNVPGNARHSPTMTGLAEEARALAGAKDHADLAVLDAALIVAAQKMAHFAMAAYGSARTFADILGATEVSGLLQENLDDETDANRLLNELARQEVNADAVEADKDIEAQSEKR